MKNPSDLKVVSALSTGKGVLVAFDNGVEAFLDASLLLRAVEQGMAFLITQQQTTRGDDMLPDAPLISA